MTQPMGMTDFFAMEAGEYLERLDAVVSSSQTPSADEFVRFARALRGSALMANQTAIAAASAGLEAFARAVGEGRRAWDPGTKQIAIRSVDDLKILVRKVGSDWTPDDDAKARAIAVELHQTVGGEGRPPTATQPAVRAIDAGPDAGARAFVAREGAAVASALDRAATVLGQNPLAHDQLQSVLRAMQPLRGLAGLADLPPMPDLLDGVERAIGEITRSRTPVSEAGAIFGAAAAALTRATKEVAATGKPAADSHEMTEFAQRLQAIVDEEGDVVAIDSLFHEDDGPHIVQAGKKSALPGTLSRVELVAHGEHLRQAADSLDKAETNTQRELRAHALAATFRALAGAGGSRMAAAAAEFASAARDAVTRGTAVRQATDFAVLLRKAGMVLSAPADREDAELASRLSDLTSRLRDLETGAPTPPAEVPTPAPAPAPPTPEPQAAPPAPTVAAPAPAPPSPSGPAADETPDLVGSLLRYDRYVAELGLDNPSLDEFLAGPPADPGAATAAPAPAAPAGSDDTATVGIETLCYSGPNAFERALSLRESVRAALADPSADRRRVQDLIEEIFDLVQLGLPAAS